MMNTEAFTAGQPTKYERLSSVWNSRSEVNSDKMTVKVVMSPHCFEKDLHYYSHLQEWLLSQHPEAQWIDMDALTLMADSAVSPEKSSPQRPRELLILMGGDGTLHQAINKLGLIGIQQYDLMVIPAGTGNDFARSLGLPLDPMKALSLMLSHPKRIQVDLGLLDMGPHHDKILFTCAISVGFGAEVTKLATREIRKYMGHFALAWGAIRYFLNRPKPLHKMKLYYHGHKRSVSALQLVIGNGKTHGGGIPISPQADLQNGLLEGYRIKPLTFWEYPYLILKALLGGNYTEYHKKVSCFRTREMIVEFSQETEVDIDGEIYMLPAGKRSLKSLSGYLSIIVPDWEALSLEPHAPATYEKGA